MLIDLLEKIPEFLKFNLADLAKIFIGAFLVGFLALNWVKSIRKATKAQVEAEKNRTAAEIAEQKAEFHRALAEQESRLLKDRYDLQAELSQAEQERRELQDECSRLLTERASLQKRLADLESFDGRLWEREHSTAPPSFSNASKRRTRLVAVMNLKGGVGKTTLTANLGVALARRGHRVLLTDLDFQGSLTRLCIELDDLRDSIRSGRTASRLLDPNGVTQANCVQEVAQRVRTIWHQKVQCHFIAASEELADAELRAQARWLVSQQPDARFLFRQAFHRQEVFDCYDLVLFDCPPRLTTACINALACCDFLLVPVILEQGSVEALPRTLNWLTRLPHVSQARLLGVVANRAEYWHGRLVAAQQTVYNYLPETIKRSGYSEAALFQAIVKNNRAKIEDAANQGHIASVDDAGLALFDGVVGELEKGVFG